MPDVARLELARRSSYHATDSNAISPDALGAIAPEDLMNVKLDLSPAVQVIKSPYPILSIWNMNMFEGAPQPEPVAQTVLLFRPELDVDMVEINNVIYCFLSNLRKNTLGAAYEAALDIDETFDLSQALGLLLTHQLITHINIQRG